MPHDVFISYSSKDKNTADAVCAKLEQHGIRCWIAPRDVLPGTQYGESIIDAINAVSVMVLVFSAASNASNHVRAEVERAASKGVAVLPLRIEEVLPGKALEFFLSSPHWLDAMTPPFERHLARLADTVRTLIAQLDAKANGLTPPAAEDPAPATATATATGAMPSAAGDARNAAAAAGLARRRRRTRRVAAAAGVVIAAAAGAWYAATRPHATHDNKPAATAPPAAVTPASAPATAPAHARATWWIDRAAAGGAVDDAPPAAPLPPDKVERRAWVQIARLRALLRDWDGADAAMAHARGGGDGDGPAYEHGAAEIERARVAAGLPPDPERWVRLMLAGPPGQYDSSDADLLRPMLGLYAFIGKFQAGDVRAAADFAWAHVEDADEQAYAALVEPLAKAGDRAGVARCLDVVERRARTFVRSEQRFASLGDLAELRAKAGDAAGAARVLAELTKTAASAQQWGRLSRARAAAAGDLPAAREALKLAEAAAAREGRPMDDYNMASHEIVLARAAVGDFAGAAAAVESMKGASGVLRRTIARDEIAAGRFDRAERMIAVPDHEYPWDMVALSRAYLAAGDRAGHQRVTARLLRSAADAERRYYAAAALLAGGDKDAAHRMLDDALADRMNNSANEGEPPLDGFVAYQQAGPLMYVRAWADAANGDRLRADVRAMRASRERVSACLSVARALIDVGRGTFDPHEFPVDDEAHEPFPTMWGFDDGMHAPTPLPVKPPN